MPYSDAALGCKTKQLSRVAELANLLSLTVLSGSRPDNLAVRESLYADLNSSVPHPSRTMVTNKDDISKKLQHVGKLTSCHS